METRNIADAVITLQSLPLTKQQDVFKYIDSVRGEEANGEEVAKQPTVETLQPSPESLDEQLLTMDDDGNIIDHSLTADKKLTKKRQFGMYKDKVDIVIKEDFAMTEEELLGYE